MNRYTYTDEVRAALEGMLQPFTVYQRIEDRIVTILVSDGFCRMIGYDDREQVVWHLDHEMLREIHPDDRKRMSDAISRFSTGNDPFEFVFRTKSGADSGYRVIHAHGEHVLTETGARLSQIWYMDEGVYVDGDESTGTRMNRELNSLLHEESILRAANYDALTGLPNLTYFFKLCEIAKERLFSQGKQGCLLYIDLYGMKYFNYRNGFAEGDKLLISFADLLAKTFGNQYCCHIGADRFAVSTTEDNLDDRVRRFFDEVEQLKQHLPVRIGIYSTGIEDVPVSTAYDRAKMACDRIPKSETSNFHYYSLELSDIDKIRRYIQTNLDKAISGKWIKVYYQPIVRAVNGRVSDEEALARWIDPEYGFLSPAEFIPALEMSGLVYKLDLYVLGQVLEKIRLMEARGLNVVPQSINLSRSDFEACDMVEEIRKRVDEAGVRRELITIEITESVIGTSFEFINQQVCRFRQLGFPVWMDDFGSGYSSLDVLQSIRFDLIKFDMSFMRKLDEGDSGKIILTDLMKMATSLGVDTVCEGVETENQVRFLEEIGCSKLQGYYFCKPIPLETIFDRYSQGVQIGYENQEESAYYEMIGRINLYDLAVVDTEGDAALQNAFSTLPMGVLEIKDGKARYVRTSQSFRDFMLRFFDFDVNSQMVNFSGSPVGYGPAFMKAVNQCCREGDRAFFDEIMTDGSIVHTFVRRIAINPITGNTAIAIAILSIREPNEKLLAEQILSVVEQFGEHMPGGFFIYKADGSEELLYANKAVYQMFGCDSLEDFKAYTGFTFRGMVHPEDYERVSTSIKDQVEESQSDLDFVEYRIIRKDGAIRWIDDYGHYAETDVYNGLYYVFISDITDKYQKAESDKALRTAVIEALTKAYDSVWLINDVETQSFELFRIDKEMEHFMPAHAAARIGKFSEAFAFYSKLVLEEDRQRFLDAVRPESIVRNTEDKLIYSIPFRRVFENGIRYYRLEFAKLDLPDDKTGIVGGFRNVDEEVRKDQQIQRSLNQRAAVIEALTQVYDSVWLINDMATQRFELYRIDEKLAHMLPAQEAVRLRKFYDAFAFYSNLVLEEDRQQFMDAVTPENIVKNTREKLIYSVPFRRIFDSGIRYYRVEFARLDLGNGEINIVAGFKDVDDEVRKDQQIQQSLALRAAVIEALTRSYDSVWLINDMKTQQFELYRIDENMVHLMPAQQAVRITRFSDAFAFYSRLVLEEDRQAFLDAVTPENIIRNTEDRLFYSVPFRRTFEDGIRYYRVEFAKLKLDNGETRIVTGFRDVDDEVRKDQQIQQALREAIDAANASNKAKSDFLSSMSHDMRTPMNGIIGMTTIATNHLDDRERVADCLQKISDSSKHLLSLINEVLDMNKIESGKVELQEEEFCLADLIDAMLTMTRPQIQSHGHSFRVNIINVEHEQLIGDSRRIEQVFVNIMSNAIKYTPDGGKISLSVREMPTRMQGYGHYQFIFEDNGYGMTEEFQKHLFEPFARAEQTAGIQGTGLGMAITRNIVRMMGGDITVESVFGEGSKFTVNMYLKLQNTEDINFASFVDLHVLVADDDPVCCESTCEILGDMGMNSEWVLSGKAAVDRVKARQEQGRDFFAVIIDWKLPGQGGVETTRQIRKLVGDKVPIIIFSAYDWSDIEQEAREAGATAFISKPLFRTKLASLFNTLVNDASGENDLEAPLKELEEMELDGHHILLAEDQELNAEIATDFLEMTGAEVDWARNGEQAVKKLEASPDGYYSMIFMDVQMPNMNGYEATQAIRAMDRPYAKEIPIVAMTANAFAEDVLRCKKAGMNEHITKPIDIDILARVLATYVR